MANRAQRSNKEAKKPKKDGGPGKPVPSSLTPPPVTTIIPRERKKTT